MPFVHCRSDDDWPPLVRLKEIKKDAAAAQSMRAQEIDVVLQHVQMLLGLEHGKTSVSTKKRPGPVFASPADPSTPQEDADGSAPDPYLKLKRIAIDLYCLDQILREVPIELRILQAVSFDAIDAREDSIEDADAATYRWLVEEPVDQDIEQQMVVARQSLLRWLSEGHGVYHISGKPGSGKSTLFKFLAHHQRIKSEIQKWAGCRELLIASFYFWNSGDAQQASYEGLQRSIFVQLLRKFPGETEMFFPGAWNTLLKAKDYSVAIPSTDLVSRTDIFDAWSELWLPSKVIGAHPYCICMFIDGLDEFAETASMKYLSVAEDFRLWTCTNPYLKICMSSRPYDEILYVLGPDQRLHLHELTSRDIRASATSEILSLVKQEELTDQGKQLVETIVEKSEGVFVWVKTVLRNIQALVASHARLAGDKLLSDASLVALMGNELLAYPSDIDDLYDHLLQRLNLGQRSTAALMFALVIQNPFSQPPNALWFSWIELLEEDPDFPGAPGSIPYTTDDVRIKHQDVRRKLGELTMGLLAMYTDRREHRNGDQFYRQRVQFPHRTARDFFRSSRGHLYLEVLGPSIAKLPETASSQLELPNPAATDSYSPHHESSGPVSSVGIVVPVIKAGVAPLSRWPTTETFARLRIAEIILAGKYKVAAGADPRRCRMYSNYLRSLLLVKDDSMIYQIPFKHMETLRKDLESTHSDTFGSAYVVSTYRKVNQPSATEDPEKPASFQHFALGHGQCEYTVEILKRAEAPAGDAIVGEKAKAKNKGKAKAEAQPEPTDEPNLILAAVFAGHYGVAVSAKVETLLLRSGDPMAYVTIRPPISSDFLSDVSLKASIPMVFSSILVFTLQRTLGGLYKTPVFNREPFVLLNRLLILAMEKSNADVTPLNFVFLLEKRKDLTIPAKKRPVPPSSNRKQPVFLSKRVPKDLYAWITSPMKNASGELIFPKAVEVPETVHPCGIEIKEKYHTTLLTLFGRYVDDTGLVFRLCDRMYRDVSAAVLNARSEVCKNIVVGDSSLEQFECTRVVASDGVVIDRDSDLSFRLY